MPTAVVNVIRLVDKYKAYAAFLVPLISAVGTALASFAVSGDFNDNEIRAAVGGTIVAIVTGIITYLTPAKQAVVSSHQVPPAV